jgi:hypothetical protein
MQMPRNESSPMMVEANPETRFDHIILQNWKDMCADRTGMAEGWASL